MIHTQKQKRKRCLKTKSNSMDSVRFVLFESKAGERQVNNEIAVKTIHRKEKWWKQNKARRKKNELKIICIVNISNVISITHLTMNISNTNGFYHFIFLYSVFSSFCVLTMFMRLLLLFFTHLLSFIIYIIGA